MNTDAIIKQLDKALAKKDDKELRLRIEVLVEILKESSPVPFQPIQPVQPVQPLPTYFDNSPTLKPPYEITSSSTKVKGSGPIVGGGEQLTYKRPKGT